MGIPLNREQRAEAKRIAWKLRLKMWSQERIAAYLSGHLGRSVTQMTVSRLLRRVEERALARLEASIALHKRLQVEQLDHLADEAMQAWEASKNPEKSATRMVKGGVTIDQTTVKERDGNPAFLGIAMQALADQRKILGLDAPPAESSAVRDLASLILEAEAIEEGRLRRLEPPANGEGGG